MYSFLIGLYIYYNKSTNKYDEFAKCLTAKGSKFYGTFWCPHCTEQKKLFSNSVKYVNYIECSTPNGNSQTQVCIDANIKSYPTWEFIDGTILTGTQSFKKLSEMTGCVIND